MSDLLASSRVDFTALTKSHLDAVEVAKTALDARRVDVSKLEAPRRAREFEGDATLVARAVSNLLENAKRHAGGVERLIESRPGRRIRRSRLWSRVRPRRRDSRFRAVLQGHVFRPKGEQSVGLGLALVKKIAEAHQGHVFAQNRAGGGAEVGASFAR